LARPRGLCKAFARKPPNPQPQCAFGVLIVDEQLNIEASTGQAERWLDTLQPFASRPELTAAPAPEPSAA
jgi:hypothetical protein